MPSHPGLGVRRLLSEMRSFRHVFIAACVLNLLAQAGGLSSPLVVRDLVTNLAAGNGVGATIVLLVLLVAFSVTAGAVSTYLLYWVAESLVLTIRQRLVRRILRLRIGDFDAAQPGDFISNVSSDADKLRDFCIQLATAATSLVTLIAAAMIMAFLDPVLLVITLAVYTLSRLASGLVMPRIEHGARTASESVSDLSSALERALSALRTVKASGAEDRESQHLSSAATDAWRGGLRVGMWRTAASYLMKLSSQVSLIVVFAIGAARVTAGVTDVATLVAFLLYLSYLVMPMHELMAAASELQVAKAALSRIDQLEQLPTEPTTGAQAASDLASTKPATVVFADVWFRYSQDLPYIHRGVSFTIPAGGLTAIVGPSGTGKTTLFSLLERFYQPTTGRITVEGRELADWPVDQLRAMIGYVEQDAPVLAGTIHDNITFGAPHATAADIAAAVHAAHLGSLITRLPDGLHTLIGHHGITLSGGERQRIAIARALLRRPRLLLLDEITSNLDAINEAALRTTVADIAQHTTVLVIAHRLSTVAQATRIILLGDDGCVSAIGTHHQLTQTQPLYAALAATQLLGQAS